MSFYRQRLVGLAGLVLSIGLTSQAQCATIGEDADAVAYDSKRGLIFSSNGGDGSLTIVRQESVDHYRVVGSLPTMQGARTLALDAATGNVYLVSAELGAAPAPTPERPHPRRVPLSNTATVLVVGAP